MPRIEGPQDYEKEDNRFLGKRLYGLFMAALCIGLAIALPLLPLYISTVEGQGYVSVFFQPSEVATAARIVAYIYSGGLLLIGGAYAIFAFMEFEKAEKRTFFTYMVLSAWSLLYTVFSIAMNNVPVLIISIVLAGLSLLLLYIDFKLFGDL